MLDEQVDGEIAEAVAAEAEHCEVGEDAEPLAVHDDPVGEDVVRQVEDGQGGHPRQNALSVLEREMHYFHLIDVKT